MLCETAFFQRVLYLTQGMMLRAVRVYVTDERVAGPRQNLPVGANFAPGPMGSTLLGTGVSLRRPVRKAIGSGRLGIICGSVEA